MNNILGPQWHLSRTHSGVLLIHNLSFKNQQKRRKATMTNNRSRLLCNLTFPVLLLAARVLQPSAARAQVTPLGVDCSKINAPSLLMQDNMRAGLILIQCGIVQGGQPTTGRVEHRLATPPNIANILV